MKIFSAIRNHPLAFSIIFLLAAFCFSHLPFFLWMGLPEVLPDTFDYANMTDIFLHRPISDIGAQPIEIPPGYPLFLLFINAISNKLITVVIIQSIAKLLSCIYLVYVCCKYYKHYGVLVSLALCIYLMNGYTIRWDTAIYTESLYSTALIILTAIIIEAINSNSILYFWLLGVFLFVPEFLRPNGIYLYFIIPVLFVYFFVRKEPAVKYFSIFVPALLLNLAWAGFNVKAFGTLIPGNFVRFSKMHVVATAPVSESAQTNPERIPASRVENLETYMSLPQFPQFYYSLWTTRYENMYMRHQVNDTSYKMYDWSTPIPDSLRRSVYKEFYLPANKFSGVYQHLKEYRGLRGVWLTAYQAWYKIDELLLRNRLLFIVFILTSLFAVYKWIASAFRSQLFLIFSLLAGLHILSIFVVVLSQPSVQLRYTQVSEFIIYVIFALIPILVVEKNIQDKYA